MKNVPNGRTIAVKLGNTSARTSKGHAEVPWLHSVCLIGQEVKLCSFPPRIQVRFPFGRRQTVFPRQQNAVKIYSDKQVCGTGTDITFRAVTEEPDLLHFLWHFGDGPAIKTSLRTITKKYSVPNRYRVTVTAFSEGRSISSEVFFVVVQRPVHLNRLQFRPSVLINTSVDFHCRLDAGTNATYLWSFGDETVELGRSGTQHVYGREGEFAVEVTVFNLVSSAFLRGRIFVVHEPCQPPPVKNMGPKKIQVHRSQAVSLGVTYEADIDCNTSQGLLYSWQLRDPRGKKVLLPAVETHRQNIELPKFFLHYGIYTAIARVRVLGSVVYSNYTVEVEVVPQDPVSVINGATNVFINRHNTAVIALNGERSHDPDYPDDSLSYNWHCRPVSRVKGPCFVEAVQTSQSRILFPASVLHPGFDQFKFTLTVKSGNRSSSSETFITITPASLREVQVYCDGCWGNAVNWNEQFTVISLCEDCSTSAPGPVLYSWKLYVVNASGKANFRVPFCSTVDMSGPSRVLSRHSSSAPDPPDSAQSSDSQPQPTARTEESTSSTSTPHTATSAAGPPDASFPLMGSVREKHVDSTRMNSGDEESLSRGPRFAVTSEGGRVTHSAHVGYADFPTTFEGGDVSPQEDYDFPFIGIEEADAGVRPTDWPREMGDSVFSSNPPDESDLLDLRHPAVVAAERTLLDLDRELTDAVVFESYTQTGISSSTISFKPYMLQPKSLYMLEVTAGSRQTVLGKSQLFFTSREAPRGIRCQIQPSKGFEIHTDFSVFCASGKEDYLYEYSYSVGDDPPRVLYEGTDFQHYFRLPAGDPEAHFKVTVYTLIKNRFGTWSKSCSATVEVLPSVRMNESSSKNPDEELLTYGVKNLKKLVQVGSSRDVHNFIAILTSALSRVSRNWSLPETLLVDARSALISAACQQPLGRQWPLTEDIYVLKELMTFTDQVTPRSAKLVSDHIKNLSGLFDDPSSIASHTLNEGVVNMLVATLSHTLEASVRFSEEGVGLAFDSLHTATDLLLKYVLLSNTSHHSVSTSLMALKTLRYRKFQNTVHSVGSTNIQVPRGLEPYISHRQSNDLCIIAQFRHFKKKLHIWGGMLNGDVADMKLYDCMTREEIKVQALATPMYVDFQKSIRNDTSGVSEFTLLRSRLNLHRFNITSEHHQQALRITVAFTPPGSKAFPVMLLFRMFEQPSPTSYSIKRIHQWEGNTVSIFIPPLSHLKDAGAGYFMLLNADYNRNLRNKYISPAVNYTLNVELSQCLSWEGVREWTPDGCTPVPGLSSFHINCSCSHLNTVTATYQEVNSQCEIADVSQYISHYKSVMVYYVMALSLAVYAVLMIVCKRADVGSQRRKAFYLLPDNNPADQQCYSITVDTGLRSAADMSAKVYIVLYGDDGVSETRELSFPAGKLFTRNSRSTFVLSTPVSLGPIWKVHLWHDNGGPCPSWYLSHVLVKDLVRGSSWFFLAQCWLAVDEDDGKVERKLVPCKSGLGFRKLLYMKMTEYLEDHHPWLSVYSGPPDGVLTRVQRLTVCLLLLHGYMGVNAVLTHLLNDQHSVELGLIDASMQSLAMGVLSTLSLLPVEMLLFLLFYFCQLNKEKNQGDHQVLCVPQILAPKANHHALLSGGCFCKPYLPCNHQLVFHDDAQRKNCEECRVDCQVRHSRTPSRSETWGDTDYVEIDIEQNNEGQPNLQSRCSADFSHGRHLPDYCAMPSDITRLPRGCHYMTWAFCSLLCLTCAVLTGTFGTKFSDTKSLLWIHALFFSLLYSIFILHPLLILIVAAVTSARYQGQKDFCDQRRTVELFLVASQSEKSLSVHNLSHDSDASFEEVIKARQRARYLRLVRPPSAEQLRSVRKLRRKEHIAYRFLRDMGVHAVVLSLLLFVTCGKTTDKFNLNKAIRTEFTRGPNSPFQSVRSPEVWWNWTFTTLLDGLYWEHGNSSTANKANALRGTCILIGEPIFTKIEASNNLPGQEQNQERHHDPSAGLSQENLCGKHGCYNGIWRTIGIGRIRSVAEVRLRELYSAHWFGRSTRAAAVQFTLYNPPSNLFATVSILVEQLPTGGLWSSAFVESTRLYSDISALHYINMTSELLFLVVTLLQLYVQICSVCQKGFNVYWKDIRNWLEVTIICLTLLYYVGYMYNFTLKVDTIDSLLRENFKKFVDLEFVALWEQFTTALLGVILFLTLVKFLFIFQMNKTMAYFVATFKNVSSKFFWSMVAGLIFVIAFSSMGNLLFHHSSHAFSSIFRSFKVVLNYSLGVRKPKAWPELNWASITAFCGSLNVAVLTFWTAVVIGLLKSFAKIAKRTSRRKSLLSFSEVAAWITGKVFVIMGKRKRRVSSNSLRNVSDTRLLYTNPLMKYE
ncbi:polycystic kidney disease 1 like 1 isoform X2 [Denticeps clupeoides]|uniref:polycystic kidney disease 1 like 1 isoform X2 n=1 Tax=Denticeps clupeoides TaxID=299321 RepID=UPI0010A4274F|nr:polycystic kidney disease protein 1-like 1 isoform X2 [Denticeps clupeoides]